MKPICSFFLLAMLFSCSGNKQAALQQEAQTFLDQYTAQYLVLRYESSLANWASNTHIVEGDTTNAFRTKQAREKVARFTGSEAHIEQARHWLTQRESLLPIQVRQLEAILYDAANNPGTVPELVSRRIAAETAQVEKLYGFDFQLDGKSVSTNDLDAILAKSKEPAARLAAWEASKEVGKGLKTGLVELRDLRNQTVQALGYDDYFGYQVSEYGMTTPEMAATCEELIRDIWPLYRELHTYARYELAARYGTEVPDYLPAHWLPDRWGQKWGSLVEVEGIDLDGLLAEKGAEWQVRQAERFYVSLGFDTLPASFYELSSLYPLPPDADYKKNNHTST